MPFLGITSLQSANYVRGILRLNLLPPVLVFLGKAPKIREKNREFVTQARIGGGGGARLG